MKNEKSVRGRAAQAVSLSGPVCVCVCVELTGYLIQPEKTERQRARDRQRGREAVERGGEAAVEKSEVVRPFPVARETNASFKGKKKTANDKHRQLCSGRIT